MSCFWILGHKWQVIGTYQFSDTSYGYGEDAMPRTTYHLQCDKCGRVKAHTVDGWPRRSRTTGADQ